MILYILWMLAYMLHDFEYSYVVTDYLAKRESYWNFANILFYFVLAITINTDLTWQIPLINSMVGILRLIDYFSEMNYFSKSTDLLVCSLKTLNFLLSFAVFIHTYSMMN